MSVTLLFCQALGVLINLTEHSGRNRRQLELTKIKGHGQDEDDELLRIQKNIGFHGDDSVVKALMDLFLKHHRMAETASIVVRQFYFNIDALHACIVMILEMSLTVVRCTSTYTLSYFLGVRVRIIVDRVLLAIKQTSRILPSLTPSPRSPVPSVSLSSPLPHTPLRMSPTGGKGQAPPGGTSLLLLPTDSKRQSKKKSRIKINVQYMHACI